MFKLWGSAWLLFQCLGDRGRLFSLSSISAKAPLQDTLKKQNRTSHEIITQTISEIYFSNKVAEGLLLRKHGPFSISGGKEKGNNKHSVGWFFLTYMHFCKYYLAVLFQHSYCVE